MKKRWLYLLGTTLLFSVLFLPSIFSSIVPTCTIVYPMVTDYEVTVAASGTVESSAQTAVTASLPIVTESVLVSEGDIVTLGQTIATVDQSASLQALLSLFAIAESYSSQLLESYGLNNLSMDEIVIPTAIIATSSGQIDQLNLTTGTLVYPSQTVAVIADAQDHTITLEVEEDDIESVAVGQTVRYTASAIDDTTFSGVVTSISKNAYDTLMGTSVVTVVSIEVTPNNNDDMRSGYSVQAQIVTDTIEDVYTLPYTAIDQDEVGEYVYTIVDGRSVRQYITVGKEFSSYAEILEGVDYNTPVLLNVSDVDDQGVLLYGQVEEASWSL